MRPVESSWSHLMKKSTSLWVLSSAALIACAMFPAHAQTPAFAAAAAAAGAQAAPAAKPSAKPQVRRSAGKPAAPAREEAAASAQREEPAVELTPGQLDAAQRVFKGKADCEFGEQIDLSEVDGKPGHFQLRHKRSTYQLVPAETTTGAVRLEDQRAGIVWLQIPAKSMLMNSKLGQRIVDECRMEPQKS
jgi:hypothetical protein